MYTMYSTALENISKEKSKKLYTVEGNPRSVFVRQVLGEGLCTSTAFVQNSRGDRDFEGSPLTK